MHLQQGKRQTTIYLLTVLLLFSLVLTACNAPWAQASKPQPLPTQTAEPGWKIVFQTHGDATNQSEGKSQNFSLGQVPTSAYYLRLSITCTGQGSARAQIEVPSLAGTETDCGDTPQTAIIDSPAIAPQAQLTVNLTISGSVKWEALVEEPV